ncbi:zinc ribbon domain-containing protein [Pseudomonas citronellolis]|uniref:zinc ribbon domain-containing protein n=1 Tax=Pseudomonas citronellolis TaxID=53408 RepID=UPI0022BA5D34|nr:zinc ribbon domain-containing protein [Pseudomonas citronellolis]WBG62194.1 zinc ribbon domain-containing protein [Pseudomonas citronellolis]
MRQIGIVLLVIGVVVVIFALSMDTTVPTEMGRRVNNIGLIAESQNYGMVGGLIIIAGLLMAIFGKRSDNSMVGVDEHKCPFCAEFIKVQAIKCKHCGSDVEPVKAEKIVHPLNRRSEKGDVVQHWVVALPYRTKAEYVKVKEGLVLTGIPVHSETSSFLKVGPYSSKDEAARILRKLMQNSLHGNIEEFWVVPDVGIEATPSAQ